MKKAVSLITLGLLVLPVAVLAAPKPVDVTFFDDLVSGLKGVVDAMVPVLVTLALAAFIWGLVSFIFASGDEAAKDEGKRRMIWGVVALFVIVSIWGLVGLLNKITGVNQADTFTAVQIIGN
jgi:hypothetical protein